MNKITSFAYTFLGLISIQSLFLASDLDAQVSVDSVTIEQCYTWSKINFHQVKQLDLIDKAKSYDLSTAANGRLPQVSINGQASYQSAVTELPIDIPNVEIPSISKDQYKLYIDVYQPLSNTAMINLSKQAVYNKAELDKQKLETELYTLRDRINQLYFGIILIDEKTVQLGIIQADIDSAMVKVEAAVANGTATPMDEQMLLAERLGVIQQVQEQASNRKAFVEMLALITGQPISSSTTLMKPLELSINKKINRPELQLFALQESAIDIQQRMYQTSLRPNFGLFAQGGYGRPALNFLNNDFDFYYIAGVKFNWNIGAFYNRNSTKSQLKVAQRRIELQREVFLLNTTVIQSQQSAEVDKYSDQLKADKAIIDVRESILQTAKVQLANGLITTLDYVRYLNEVSKAKQMLLLHEAQLLLSKQNLKTTSGN